MKILVISDTHGLEKELLQVKEKYKNEVDYMIHCGDSELSTNHDALEGLLVVKGNCDFGDFPNDLIQDIGEKTLFVTHGHLYNVKMSIMNIQYRTEEVGATITCFGHSHLAGSELIDGKLFVNPGSFRLPRRIPQRTYCILELYENKVNVLFFDHQHNKVDALCNTYII